MAVAKVAGLRAIVTGGSSGIGLAAAQQLVSEGAHVGICARDPATLRSAQETLSRAARFGGRVIATVMDVRSESSVKDGLSRMTSDLGAVDRLLVSAGVCRPDHFDTLREEDFADHMETNFMGAVRVTRACWSPVIATRGHISYVASVAGVVGIWGYSAYAPTKFALAGFAECVRQELKPHGVTVSVLYPPDTDTRQLAQENLTKPRETHAISGTIKPLSAESVARAWIDGIEAKRVEIVPDLASRAVIRLARTWPAIFRWYADDAVRRTRAKA